MSESQPDGTREQRLREVLQKYLEAVDAGQAPAREELLRAHPDLTADLETYFADQDRIEWLAAPLRPAPVGSEDAPTLPPPESVPGAAGVPLGTVRYIGDYELLEEIARGGMGVVYRARQVSVDRIVAVKMLLTGAFANADEVLRFKVETVASANLDHPNLLPIYEVGDHESR